MERVNTGVVIKKYSLVSEQHIYQIVDDKFGK